ncbi:MAG TPA: anti-sigma factor [Acidimicrobiales bacterium]|nr:anti-sigma factor [Acidimicrobiales bacterium]
MAPERSRAEDEQCGGNAAPFVLGALTESEHEAFRRHLEGCAVCREEVAALQVAASALPAAAPQVSAPAELKRKVMADFAESFAGRDERAEAPGPAHRGREGSRATGSRLRWRPNLAVAVLAAAAIGLAVVALFAGGGAGGTRVLRATVLVPHASATLLVSGDHADLDVAGMPQAGPGRVYEVWREESGRARPTDALFTVSSDGGRATVSVPGGVRGVNRVLVTSEPEGGSVTPTRSPVIVAPVS